MDGNEKPGIEPCGIPAEKRAGLSIGIGSGGVVAAVGIDDKAEIYWCRCRTQQQCAIQELALRLAAANEGNHVGRDGKAETRSGRVRRLQGEQDPVGDTAPPAHRDTERRRDSVVPPTPAVGAGPHNSGSGNPQT